MFGGQGQDDAELLNDLWLIRPNQLRNKGSIDIENLRYKSQDPELTLTIECISEFSGQAPCPRYGATMVHLNLQQSNQQLLVVYGGRNDNIYEWTGSMTLNDVCIFNINLCKWQTLAMFGQMPPSRTNHTMLALNDLGSHRADFLIFGGTNQNAYCRNRIYKFTLVDNKQSKSNSILKKSNIKANWKKSGLQVSINAQDQQTVRGDRATIDHLKSIKDNETISTLNSSQDELKNFRTAYDIFESQLHGDQKNMQPRDSIESIRSRLSLQIIQNFQDKFTENSSVSQMQDTADSKQ